MKINIGINNSDKPVLLELCESKANNVMVAGNTGSGKTYYLQRIAYQIAQKASKERMYCLLTNNGYDWYGVYKEMGCVPMCWYDACDETDILKSDVKILPIDLSKLHYSSSCEDDEKIAACILTMISTLADKVEKDYEKSQQPSVLIIDDFEFCAYYVNELKFYVQLMKILKKLNDNACSLVCSYNVQCFSYQKQFKFKEFFSTAILLGMVNHGLEKDELKDVFNLNEEDIDLLRPRYAKYENGVICAVERPEETDMPNCHVGKYRYSFGVLDEKNRHEQFRTPESIEEAKKFYFKYPVSKQLPDGRITVETPNITLEAEKNSIQLDHDLLCEIRAAWKTNNSLIDRSKLSEKIEGALCRHRHDISEPPKSVRRVVMELVYNEFLRVPEGPQWGELAEDTHNLPELFLAESNKYEELKGFNMTALRYYARIYGRDEFVAEIGELLRIQAIGD